jgi:cytochrome b6-f complex iron-sulfur subunit
MADKKPTTEEILARLRKQDAGGGEGATAEKSSAPAPEAPAAADDAPAPSRPAAKPTSTTDILAAARAQAGGASPAKPKPAGAKPAATADILAAARAQGGGAAAPKAGEVKPAGGAKSGSTSDILAAARAQGGGAAATAGGATAKPAAGAAASAARKTAPPAGERPSVADMIKAAREGRPMEEPAPPAGPRLPARPPVPKVARSADDPNRRGFVASAIIALATPYYLAWSVLALIGGVWSLLVARFMMPNMIVEPPMKFKVGPASEYPAGTVSEKWKAERGIWIVNTDSYDGRNLIYALASVCTHLGCTPNWLDGEQKFKCPCHGSGFYINGINFEGPAPRPLERVGIRLSEDGSLEVDKSVKFQEELGQWQDPSSFVELA